MAEAVVIACDWGTTNLRAWTLTADGEVAAARDFPGLGVSRLAPGEAARRFADEVRPGLGAERLPAIMCGMVGSTLGWVVAPYVDCPAALSDLARGLTPVEDAGGWVRIAPGVKGQGFNGQGDVMRGEETQLFGWIARNPDAARGRRIVCHPGTHTKWMLTQDGRLTSFVTAMTGELFAVLTQHSVLQSTGSADDMSAFDEGVAAAGEGDALAARLFTARARVVGLGRPAQSTPGYLSGLLIAADAASAPRLLGLTGREPVTLLGDERLCGLYARALAQRGVATEFHDGGAAAVAGLFALFRETRR